MPADPEKIKLAHAVFNDIRYKIIKRLLHKSTYISDLEKNLKINRSTICYHLNILEEAGLLKSEYEILLAPRSMGKAARKYTINLDKLNEAIEALIMFGDELKS